MDLSFRRLVFLVYVSVICRTGQRLFRSQWLRLTHPPSPLPPFYSVGPRSGVFRNIWSYFLHLKRDSYYSLQFVPHFLTHHNSSDEKPLRKYFPVSSSVPCSLCRKRFHLRSSLPLNLDVITVRHSNPYIKLPSQSPT